MSRGPRTSQPLTQGRTGREGSRGPRGPRLLQLPHPQAPPHVLGWETPCLLSSPPDRPPPEDARQKQQHLPGEGSGHPAGLQGIWNQARGHTVAPPARPLPPQGRPEATAGPRGAPGPGPRGLLCRRPRASHAEAVTEDGTGPSTQAAGILLGGWPRPRDRWAAARPGGREQTAETGPCPRPS